MAVEMLLVKTHVDAAGNRTLTVDAWPRETMIDSFLIAQSDPEHLRRVGDAVIIEVANGRAVYELTGDMNIASVAYPARLVSSRLTEEPADG